MDLAFKKPIQNRSQKRMQLVLNSTKILLELKPIDQISIPEIAKHADVPRSSIYQYFPTLSSILNELTQQQMLQLLLLIQSHTEHYLQLSLIELLKNLILETAQFYNHNPIASLLILKGSISAESYQSQQTTIHSMAQNIIFILENLTPPVHIRPHDEIIEHLIEITFSLMKYSYFKNGKITTQVQTDIFDLCSLYLQHKGYH